MSELDAMEIAAWNLHADDLQGKHRCDMILGRDKIYELKIDLFSSKYINKENGGA